MIPSPRLVGLTSTLERAERPLLLCHTKPDGDAIGASLGLAHLLYERGAKPQLLCSDPVPAHYRFLVGSDGFIQKPPGNHDVLVMIDCPNDDKTGFDLKEIGGPIVDIDHHPKSTRPPTPRLAVYDSEASSASEMMYELADHAKWRVGREAATALLTGIVFDTSAFQNANTTRRTLEVSAALLRAGARHKEVIKHVFYNSTVPKLRLWGTAMARIEQNPKAAGIVSTVITADDLADCGAHPDDLEGLVNFLNAIPGVPAMLLLTDLHHGEVKGSLRTRDRSIDVNRLAKVFGGGGHTQAAGFSIPGRLVKNIDDTWQVAPPDGIPRNPTRIS